MEALDLAYHTQARVPDGIDYTTAALRYRGHVVSVMCLSRRNTSGTDQGYQGLEVDRESIRPVGDENFQRIIPRGHWVTVGEDGLANWLRCGFTER